MRCIGTKIDNQLHERLIERCNVEGVTPSEYVRSLVRMDLEEESSISEVKKSPRTWIIDEKSPEGRLLESDP